METSFPLHQRKIAFYNLGKARLKEEDGKDKLRMGKTLRKAGNKTSKLLELGRQRHEDHSSLRPGWAT